MDTRSVRSPAQGSHLAASAVFSACGLLFQDETRWGRPRVRTSFVRTSRRLLEDLSHEDLPSEDLRGTVSYVEHTTLNTEPRSFSCTL